MADHETDNSSSGSKNASPDDEISEKKDSRLARIRRFSQYIKGLSNGLSFWSLFWRMAIYTVVTFSLLIAAIIGWSKHYVNNDRLQKWIQDLVHQETGGRIEIGKTHVDILNGFSLHDVRIFPPISNDSSSTNEQLWEQNKPALSIERVELGYSLLGLLAGQINIRALKIIRPIVWIERNGGKSNIDGFLLHIETKNQERKSIKLSDTHDDSSEESTAGVVDFSKISPSMLYMPVKIIARNIGIERLKVEMIENYGNREIKRTVLDGPTIDVWSSWYGTKSNLGISVGSYFDQAMHLSISVRNQDQNISQEKLIFAAEAKVVGQLIVDDLRKIKINIGVQTNNLHQGSIDRGNIALLADANLEVVFDKMQLEVRRIGVEIPDTFRYLLEGNLKIIDLNTRTIAIDILNNASLNIGELMDKISPFVPWFRGSGNVDIADLRIHGVVESDNLKSMFSSDISTPEVSGEIIFDEISLESKNPEASINGMVGSIKFGGAKALTGGGVGLDHLQKLHINSLKWKGQIPESETITAEALGIDIESAARFVWPKIHAQMTRLIISTEALKVSGNKTKGWNAPLYFEFSAEGDKEISRNIGSLNVEWKDLLDISASIDCQLKCQKFGGEFRTKIKAFDGLYGAIIGRLDPYLDHSLKPTRIAGSLDIQIDLEGRNPSGLSVNVNRFLEEADLEFKSRVALSRVDLKVPLSSFEIDDLTLRIDMDGDLKDQRVSFDSKTKEMKCNFGNADKSMIVKNNSNKKSIADDAGMVVAEGLSISFDLLNKFTERPNITTITDKMITEISAKASLGNIFKSGSLLNLFSLGRISIEIDQEAFRQISVRRIATILPELGFGSAIKGKISLNDSKIPTDFELDSEFELSRTESLNVISGISTRGAIKSSIKASTEDMKKVVLSGALDFDRFALTVLNLEDSANPKLVVEDVNGQIPIEQSIVIPKGFIPSVHEGNTDEYPKDNSGYKKFNAFGDPGGKNGSGDILSAKLNELEGIAKKYLQDKAETKQNESSKLVNVDYSSVRDFFPKRKAVSIKRCVLANIEMSDITLDVEWREGIVGLNEFMIGVLGGQMQGNVQVNITTDIDRIAKNKNKLDQFLRKIITNIQVTRMDTRKILDRMPGYKESPSRITSLFADPYIDATLRVFWNIESRDLEGGIDITTIGKEQVRMLLSYIDPAGSDPTINDIRKGLIIGDVRKVSIPIKNGEIGLDVEIKALSLPIPTPKLSRFPISQLIDNAIRSQSS